MSNFIGLLCAFSDAGISNSATYLNSMLKYINTVNQYVKVKNLFISFIIVSRSIDRPFE